MRAVVGILVFVIYSVILVMTIVGIPVLVFHLIYIFGISKKRIERAKKKLAESLMEGEGIVVIAGENRVYALFSRRSLVAITNSRVIFYKRPVFGGFAMTDVQWKDVIDARMAQHVFPMISGAQIWFSHTHRQSPIVLNVDFKAANEMYRYAQNEEQAWEEKRRVRKMEETRAAAGGTYITAPAPVNSNNLNEQGGSSTLEQIKEAKEMQESGVISDVEFNELKSKILNYGRSQ